MAFFRSSHSEVPYDAIVAILLGFASAVVDNVPLVAAAQGMSSGRFYATRKASSRTSESTDKNVRLYGIVWAIYIIHTHIYIYISQSPSIQVLSRYFQVSCFEVRNSNHNPISVPQGLSCSALVAHLHPHWRSNARFHVT